MTLIVKVDAQSPWASAELIYSSSDVESPVGVSDRYGNLHVFWWGTGVTSQLKSDPTSIFYSRWDGQTWTTPTDILLSPNGERTYHPGVVVDNNDRLHLIWNGSTLYYSSALVYNAESPREWSAPVSISAGIPVATQSSIAVGPDGSLHVVFSEAGGDVYHVYSSDMGITWNDPNILTSVPDNFCSMMPHIAIGHDGKIHIVWSQAPLPEAYPPSGVYYARSEDGGLTWTDPTQFARDGYGEANIIIDANANLHIVWNGRATVAGRYHVYSDDEGQTWSNVITVVDPSTSQAGLTGEPGLVTDSIGGLYFIGGGAIFNEWTNGGWAAPISLVDLAYKRIEYVENPSLVISGGNRLNAILMDGRKNLWHTWKTINAPHEEYVANNVDSIPSEPFKQIDTETPWITAIPTTEPAWLNDDAPSSNNRNWGILGGLLPLVFIPVIARRMKKGK